MASCAPHKGLFHFILRGGETEAAGGGGGVFGALCTFSKIALIRFIFKSQPFVMPYSADGVTGWDVQVQHCPGLDPVYGSGTTLCLQVITSLSRQHGYVGFHPGASSVEPGATVRTLSTVKSPTVL